MSRSNWVKNCSTLDIAGSFVYGKLLRCLRFWGTVLIGLLLSHPLLAARVDKKLLRSYKKAKKHYFAANYEAAKVALAPMMDLEQRTDITPYALFYYALTAYAQGNAAEATSTFNKLIEVFPNWGQKNEVWYWLGQLKFEAGDQETGLGCLSHVTAKELEEPVQRMKHYFLTRLGDFEALHALLLRFPTDPIIAQVFFDQIADQPLIGRRTELLERLARNVGFDLASQSLLRDVTSCRKERYNVAVFFPFALDEIDGDERFYEGTAMALYQGIRSATTALAEEGIGIDLFAYDTKEDPITTASLLDQAEVSGMDLIIGPPCDVTTPLIADFARTHQINFFDPLAEHSHVVGSNPFAFLFRPSLETQAKRAAEFTLQSSIPEGHFVGIICGTSEDDLVQAKTYQEYIEYHTGGKIALMLPMTPNEAQNCLQELRNVLETSKAEGEEETTKEDGNEGRGSLFDLTVGNLTHIYVASKDALVVASVLSAVEMLGLSLQIIGYEAWLEQGVLTLDQLQRLRIWLIAPGHIDYTRKGVHLFRSEFCRQFAWHPNHCAYIGYDLMLFLGRMLDQYGTCFQKHWTNGIYPNAIFEGLAYGIHHDNQHVPIVQLKNRRFITCNGVVKNR